MFVALIEYERLSMIGKILHLIFDILIIFGQSDTNQKEGNTLDISASGIETLFHKLLETFF
jgi:hypothetical protein